MESFRIALVDDKPFNIQIIKEKLLAKSGIDIVLVSYSGKEFLESISKIDGILPDLVLMDIDMPELDGIETVKRAKILYPNIHFVMITIFDDAERVFNAICAGASGYLLKDDSITDLHKAIDDVMIFGGAPMSPSIARKAFQFIQGTTAAAEETKSPLSAREMDIMNGLAKGNSYTVIADELFISPHTVRKHMTNIYEKLHVNSKVEAIRMALDKKWVW
jgi:DNA-binding NarL/FixJ family response regulator